MKLILALLATAVMASAASTSTKVDIRDYAFQKMPMTITAGSTVTWTNRDDDPHTVTADDKTFDSKGLGQDDTWSHTFAKPGVYRFHCSVHPFMKGTIVVTEAPTHV
jgi:plastocyanin